MILCLVLASTLSATVKPALVVKVDLTDAPRRLFKAQLVVPAVPGPMELVYPKWLPGEHGPTGPVTDLVGLHFKAGARELPFEHDPEDMYAVKINVPSGVSEVQVDLQFASPPPESEGFSGGASATANLAVFSWNQVLLFPKGTAAAQLEVKASLQLPAKWKWASAMLETKGAPGVVTFAPVSLEMLVDSPVLTGQFLNVSALGSNHGAPVSIAIAAETSSEAQLKPEQLEMLKRLVNEEAALFGARHFERYVFLLALSDSVAHFGLEHHQSSDNRLPGRTLLDKELGYSLGSLLAHESVHSWNGKYRRPVGLATPDFQAPMRGELLWIYEGLTQYLGHVLTARCGAWDPQMARDMWALTAENQRNQKGRNWRSVEDTAVAAQMLYPARSDWAALRRRVDFYDEGNLIWLEVDARLREKSKGTKSIDDFVKVFHGGTSGPAVVMPYTLDDVIAALNTVVEFDWKTLLTSRVRAVGGDAPLAGLELAGFRLGYSSKPTESHQAWQHSRKRVDLRSSLGLLVNAESLAVVDVTPQKSADRAKVGPAMKVVGVNGRKATAERLLQAVDDSKTQRPVLLLENAETLQTATLEYDQGLKYPQLEAIEGKTDLLKEIIKAKTK